MIKSKKVSFVLSMLVISAILFSTGLTIFKVNAEPSAPRGRVAKSNGTLVTDTGTYLRGCYMNTETGGTNPTSDQINALKNYGINAVHLYAEKANAGYSAGKWVANVDDIVNKTGTAGLYCIITIGGGSANGTFDPNFITDFWTFYAPRYKNNTHVIYEIQNEPEFAYPYSAATRTMEKNAYNLIRSYAPNTHVMLFTYSKLTTWANVQSDINGVGIDWTNASIAWHGYERDTASITDTFNAIKNAGYASMSTEVPNIPNTTATQPALIRMCETMGSSWLSFVRWNNLTVDVNWKDKINWDGIGWTPDFGTWPSGNAPINPYNKLEAENCYDLRGTLVTSCSEGTNSIGAISNNDYIHFKKYDFGVGATGFTARVSSPYANSYGNNIEIRLDSPTGTLVGTCSVLYTGSWDTYTTVSSSITSVSGNHDFYLVFKGNAPAAGMFNLNWIQFN